MVALVIDSFDGGTNQLHTSTFAKVHDPSGQNDRPGILEKDSNQGRNSTSPGYQTRKQRNKRPFR